MLRAICVLNSDKIKGTVRFYQKNDSNKVKVEYDIKGLSNGLHGFHIHEYGDLSEGCESSCAHFNPFGKTHGGPRHKIRHVGDLGNICSYDGLAMGGFNDSLISLRPESIVSIIGRCVVVHDNEDDLGKGGDEESLKTGNAGKRLACGVIGWARP